jgi:WD40 repeat protein/tRNA A-37 threonylcarbamoyl transferase component Bud32
MNRERVARTESQSESSDPPSHPNGETALGSIIGTPARAAGQDDGGATTADIHSDSTAGPTSANDPSSTVAQEHQCDLETDSPIASRTSRFLADYEVLCEVARGGMGIVYRARQVHLNRIVALKLVRDPSLASYTELRRFRAEADAIAQLDHPNIVPIYEVGQVEDQPYFSMKLIEGGNLTAHVARLREDPRAAATLMAKVARAVHFAHQRAILHRDIKPSNILLGEDDEPFVSDFGLAKRIGPDSGAAATVTGAVMGTPAYMPPEQARGGTKSVTTAADVYSLGATLYETLTGRPPFAGDSAAEILRRVLDEAPARPRTLNAGVDRDLETICLKCLEKEPGRRYGSAEALAEDLGLWLEGRPIEARPVSARERAVKWVRRHRTLAALIAVSAISLLCIGVGTIWFTLALRAALGSAEDRLYIAEVNLARRDIDNHLPVLAKERLDKQIPNRPWKTDRRGFEWFFLQRLARPQTLSGHRSNIRSIAFHPSGGLLASCGDDGTVRIWDLATGASFAPPVSHSGWLDVLTFSPDGKWLATGGNAKVVTIWAVPSFRPHRTLALPSIVWDLSFSHDSRRLALMLNDQVRVEGVESDQGVFSIPNPRNLKHGNTRSRPLAFSPDGRSLAMSRDENILICEVETRQVRPLPQRHTGAILSLAFSRDSRLASSSEDGTIRVWDPASGVVQHVWRPEGVVNRVAFSHDGRLLASASMDQQAKLWDVVTGREWRAFPHPMDVQAVAFQPDDNRLATAGGDGVVKVWDISGRESTPLAGHRGAVLGVAVRGDGSQIASIGSDNSLGFWTVNPNLEVQRPPSLAELPFKPQAVAYSTDGRYLAVSGADGRVQVWDTLDRRLVQRINDEPRITVMGVAFSPDKRSLAAVGTEGSAKVWDWTKERITQTLHGLEGTTIFAVAYSPDGRRLATAGGDRVTRLWDTATGRFQSGLEGHTDFVYGLAFSPDGRFLASAGADQAVLLWDLSGWSIASTPLKGHSAAVLGLSFSPQRRRMRIASAGADRTVKVWDTATGLEALTLGEHTDRVTAVAFDPAGRILVSASRDGTLRIWDARE